MSEYTELLSMEAETLSPEEDGYEESLLQIAALFRGFHSALTSFMEAHGYTGDPADTGEKVRFLRGKFKAAGVKPPHDFKEWFLPNAAVKRDTAYKICFAFGLGIAETNDFFRCVQFARGFDCHTVREAVYYFCIKNGYSYTQAQEIIGRIPVQPKAKKLPPDQEVLYTGTILEDLNGIGDPEELIRYITDHARDFRYNNATAIKYIRELWTEISRPNGLAVQEGRLIAGFNFFEDRHRKGVTDIRPQSVIDEEVDRQKNEVRPDDFVVATDDASAWTVFAQILGMRNYMATEYAQKYDRSLAPVLSENVLMPLNAGDCFPGQHSIEKILRGELGDNEQIRKMIIFLVFYTYWVKRIVGKNDTAYVARRSDAGRCLETVNGRLLSAGYPALYSGNPYDWLFLWSLNDDHPLDAFRAYMGEVFAVSEERAAESH